MQMNFPRFLALQLPPPREKKKKVATSYTGPRLTGNLHFPGTQVLFKCSTIGRNNVSRLVFRTKDMAFQATRGVATFNRFSGLSICNFR